MTEAVRTIRVSVNGELHELPAHSTVHDLLAQAGIDPTAVGVECNRRIVSKRDYDATRLNDGDQLEVVTFVGGG